MQTALELLPSAKDAMQRLTAARAEDAAKRARADAAAAETKKTEIDRLLKPSGLSDDEAIERAIRLINRAIGAGQVEVQLSRFPNTLCTDGGRAINQQEPGWQNTLNGVPKEMYQLWEKYFRPRGYKLRAEIVDFPDGMPGDVAITLKWA